MSQDTPNEDNASKRAERVEALFLAAIQRPKAERTAFIRAHAQSDVELAEEVLDLLSRQDDTEDDDAGVTYRPTDDETIDDVSNPARITNSDRWIGRDIGPAKSITVGPIIGEGGMGAVYKCEQRSPKRTVAVKILREAIPSERALRRFEFEAQTLARMDHPGIARIHAADLIDEHGIKIPYFVMAYIDDAHTLPEYAERHQLDLRQRLQLFRSVCDAVGHAHLKGVLHRDLKPANVLVDKNGRIKIIDFGVARAIDRDEDTDVETILQTQAGHVVGTPRYMSPEQLEGARDLDARVDVYALGVLLYELLCHSAPYEMSRDLSNIRKTVLEVEPIRPSSIDRTLRGDVEAILLKALEKEREGRYRDALALGEDIDRHLNNEPVTAQPPTLFYTLRKVARRNRPAFGAAGFALLVLLVAVIASTSFFVRERAARADALVQAERAEARSAELQQVVDFQAEQLTQVDPRMMATRMRQDLIDDAQATLESRNLPEEAIAERIETLQQALAYPNLTNVALKTLETTLFEPTLEAIDTQFADQPLVRAQMLQTFASTTRDLGLLELATEPQEEALAIRRAELGDLDELTLKSITAIGRLLGALGKHEESLLYAQEAHDGARRTLGDEHALTQATILNLGSRYKDLGRFEEAAPYYQEALDLRRRLFADDESKLLVPINNMGVFLQEQGRFEEAQRYLEEAVEKSRRLLGNDDSQTLYALNNLGYVLKEQGKYAQAEQCYEEAIEGNRRTLGTSHQYTLASINNMGLLLHGQGKFEQAELYFKQAMKGFRTGLGDMHPHTLTAIGNVGSLLRMQSKYEEAQPYLQEALDSKRRILGNDHPSTLTSLNGMSNVLLDQGKYAEAQVHLQEVLDGRLRLYGDDHPRTLEALNNIGYAIARQGHYEEALPYYQQSLDIKRRTAGEDHPSTLSSLCNLSGLLRDYGKYEQAESLGKEALERSMKVLGEEHRDTLDALASISSILHARGKYEEALASRRKVVDARRRVLGNNHKDTLSSISNMAFSLYTQGRYDEARPLFEEAVAGNERLFGDEHVITLRYKSMLGLLLHTQGKYEEAAPIHQEALEISRRTLNNKNPSRLTITTNMARFLIAQGEFDEADEYCSEVIEIERESLGDEHPATLSAINLMADIRSGQNRLTDSEALRREALAGRRTALGDTHPKTLESILGLASVLFDLERYEEALELAEECETGMRSLHGDEHAETLKAIALLADVRTAIAGGDPVIVEDADSETSDAPRSTVSTANALSGS